MLFTSSWLSNNLDEISRNTTAKRKCKRHKEINLKRTYLSYVLNVRNTCLKCLTQISLTHTHPRSALPSPILIPHNHFPLQHSSLTTRIHSRNFPSVFFVVTFVDSPMYVRFLHSLSNLPSLYQIKLLHMTTVTLYCAQ